MSRRPSNWPALLAQFIEDKQRSRFDWQTNNCAFFACDWIALLTGIDPAQEYRPRVKSALSAARVLKAAGGIDAITTAECARNNWPEAAPSFARRGDVVLHKNPQALGVCVGVNTAFLAMDGIVFVPTTDGARAWRIA